MWQIAAEVIDISRKDVRKNIPAVKENFHFWDKHQGYLF